jgi:hypothetical protein
MSERDPIYALHLFTDKKIIPWIKQTFLRSGWVSEYIIISTKIKNQQEQIDHQTWEISSDQYGINCILEKAKPFQIIY